MTHLILASSSPRRAEILTSLGIPFEIAPADVDETFVPGESGREAARRFAREKAAAGAARHPDDWVLAADTLVLLDGAILGKPRDDADAARMLRQLSGREHCVVTALALKKGPGPGAEAVAGSFTNVMGLPARTVYRLLRESPDPALVRLALAFSPASSRTFGHPLRKA